MMKKRTIAAALSLLLCCFGANALAKTETKYGLTISSENGDWAFSEIGDLTITKPGEYTLSGSGRNVRINDVKDAVTLTLDGVTLNAAEPHYMICALEINNSSSTTIRLHKTNTLYSGFAHAGLEANNSGSVEIKCAVCPSAGHTCGKLIVQGGEHQAGIAAYRPASLPDGSTKGTSLVISSGVIESTGGANGAGIGPFGSKGSIRIIGGTVTA